MIAKSCNRTYNRKNKHKERQAQILLAVQETQSKAI